ncbi:hypothetical protein BDZ45DRAFT_808533 [Acephala macrosclerotiorum]|nr:hypothetical protein BDZ45DRAFT_808533 [Acephala macrosclerotiorum]
MCTGTITTLTCPHTLIHYTSFCFPSSSDSSKPNPKPCLHPRGPVRYLSDTCASCHPPFQIAAINQHHDHLHSELTKKMRQAGTKEEVWELKKKIDEAHWQRGRELREVGGLRWDGVVRWGGRQEGEGEDGIIWTEDPKFREWRGKKERNNRRRTRSRRRRSGVRG